MVEVDVMVGVKVFVGVSVAVAVAVREGVAEAVGIEAMIEEVVALTDETTRVMINKKATRAATIPREAKDLLA